MHTLGKSWSPFSPLAVGFLPLGSVSHRIVEFDVFVWIIIVGEIVVVISLTSSM